MPLYNYTVKDKAGKTIVGKMDQESTTALASKLKEMQFTVIDISAETANILSLDVGTKFSRIKVMDKVTFYIKLATMIKAGVPLAASLASVKDQLGNNKLRKIIDNIHRNILAGNSLSQSLALYPKIFPELLINVIQSGEASGKLTEVLEQYALFAENQVTLRQKITSALIYPAIILIAAFGLMTIFLTYLLPKFVTIFDNANIPLPLPTQLLVNLGNFLGNNAIAIIVTLIILFFALKIAGGLKHGKSFLDIIKLKCPIAGTIARKVAVSRFTRTLGTLYQSGVPILKSLEICETATGNTVFGRAIKTIREEVTKGKSLASMMEVNPLFPADIVQMISVGENSGNLGDMLEKISIYYERDIDYAVRNATSIIEPLIICFVGLLVGLLVYSIIMPIFNMMDIM